jgi:hypothetical protein
VLECVCELNKSPLKKAGKTSQQGEKEIMKKEVLSVEALQAMRDDLSNSVSASALDFVETYEATSSAYFCDAFQEFADSQTSIYYSDQRRYYEEHSSDCEDALMELYGPNGLAAIIKESGIDGLLCKAGAVGEYQSIENDLNSDFEKIKIILALDYIIEHGLLFNEERLSDLMLELEDIDQNDHIDAIRDIIENNLE